MLFRQSCFVTFFVAVLSQSMFAQRYEVGEATSVDSSTRLILLSDRERQLEAAIAPRRGGELSGLRILVGGKWIETIYLARDYGPKEGWTGKAPLLWPATGRNFPPDLEARQRRGERFGDGAYVLGGKRYPMPIHGFARELAWEVEESRADERGALARLRVSDSADTLQQYPFRFWLTVEYRVFEGILTLTYRVRSDGANKQPMPFSIGNHITFNCPLLAGSDADRVILETPSETEILKTPYGTPTGLSKPRTHAEGIALGDFEKLAAVSLTGYREEPYVVYRDPQGLAIRLSHRASHTPPQPVVLFNLWGDPGQGFFSPEPWVGLQNSLVLDRGLISLPAGEEFEWTIRLEVTAG